MQMLTEAPIDFLYIYCLTGIVLILPQIHPSFDSDHFWDLWCPPQKSSLSCFPFFMTESWQKTDFDPEAPEAPSWRVLSRWCSSTENSQLRPNNTLHLQEKKKRKKKNTSPTLKQKNHLVFSSSLSLFHPSLALTPACLDTAQPSVHHRVAGARTAAHYSSTSALNKRPHSAWILAVLQTWAKHRQRA